MRVLFLITVVLTLNFTISCKKSDEIMDNEKTDTKIDISGYGGDEKIDLGKGNWEILKVKNGKINQQVTQSSMLRQKKERGC